MGGAFSTAIGNVRRSGLEEATDDLPSWSVSCGVGEAASKVGSGVLNKSKISGGGVGLELGGSQYCALEQVKVLKVIEKTIRSIRRR